jgi:hypothetical protein
MEPDHPNGCFGVMVMLAIMFAVALTAAVVWVLI